MASATNFISYLYTVSVSAEGIIFNWKVYYTLWYQHQCQYDVGLRDYQYLMRVCIVAGLDVYVRVEVRG